MPYADKVLTCRGCGSRFTFTAGEQAYYESKNLTSEPSRCRRCREARRRGDPEDGAGYVKYGSFASFGGRTPRQMHPATCSRCGAATEVPFEPHHDRPVYCSPCFDEARKEGGDSARTGGWPSDGR